MNARVTAVPPRLKLLKSVRGDKDVSIRSMGKCNVVPAAVSKAIEVLVKYLHMFERD